MIHRNDRASLSFSLSLSLSLSLLLSQWTEELHSAETGIYHHWLVKLMN